MTITYVLGDEEYLKERAALSEIEGSLTKNVIKIKYKDFLKNLDLYEIPDEDTIYLVHDCQEPYYSPNINAVMIFSDGVFPKIPPEIKRVLDFKKLKSYDNNNEVVKWILREGEALKIDLSRVVNALFLNSGNRLRKLSSEIGKIRTLSKDGDIVSPDLAKSVLCFSAELTPKSVLDSIINGKTNAAISYYDKLQEQGNETGWILSYIISFFLQIARYSVLTDLGVSNKHEVLGINTYKADYLSLHCDKWSKKELVKTLENLIQIEIKHKSGDLSADFMLELEIIRLSEESSSRLPRH
jgi:hypothetical protein